jgi:hypothetical protein
MDAQAVDIEILSINPFWYNRERDLAAQIVKLQNEKLAEFCAANPSRRSPRSLCRRLILRSGSSRSQSRSRASREPQSAAR